MNYNNEVAEEDITVFSEKYCNTALAADMNHDGVVDEADLVLFLQGL